MKGGTLWGFGGEGNFFPCPKELSISGLAKKRVFLKKPSPAGFFGFFWVFLGFIGFYWVFLGFLILTRIFHEF